MYPPKNKKTVPQKSTTVAKQNRAKNIRAATALRRQGLTHAKIGAILNVSDVTVKNYLDSVEKSKEIIKSFRDNRSDVLAGEILNLTQLAQTLNEVYQQMLLTAPEELFEGYRSNDLLEGMLKIAKIRGILMDKEANLTGGVLGRQSPAIIVINAHKTRIDKLKLSPGKHEVITVDAE